MTVISLFDLTILPNLFNLLHFLDTHIKKYNHFTVVKLFRDITKILGEYTHILCKLYVLVLILSLNTSWLYRRYYFTHNLLATSAWLVWETWGPKLLISRTMMKIRGLSYDECRVLPNTFNFTWDCLFPVTCFRFACTCLKIIVTIT